MKKKYLLALILLMFPAVICASTNADLIGVLNFIANNFMLIIMLLFVSIVVITLSLFFSAIKPASNNIASVQNSTEGIKCPKCNKMLPSNFKFCDDCGFQLSNSSVNINQSNNQTVVNQSIFDPILSMNEKDMVEEFINRELVKAGIDKNSKLIPCEVIKRKKIFCIIFSILLFIYISLIFFHLSTKVYIIGAIILFIFYKIIKKYNLMKYLVKQLKSRPKEKVSNIVMGVTNTLMVDNTKSIFVASLCIAIILPLIIFINPRIFYEKTTGGYSIRFYTVGLTNFSTVDIPATHKKQNVVSIRGNVFANMRFLKEVHLPDTITEIRGEAFKNDISLEKINLPKYLTEIKGSTFENCRSLKSIEIPDSVTRIGGHAFYGNSSLSSVILTQNSSLIEIGSSAFRKCYKLYEITLPNGVYVNSRAFKESPTTIKYFNYYELQENNNSYNYYESFN